jgi:3'-phosphoadenosine 5'-phosphosulfate sulfotransferase (PAPS reductase)/FAD synthetase
MISFGAGVNSVAMTIMLVEGGWRGRVVFADPGAEHPDTYCYLTYFEREWLTPRGLSLTRLSPEATPDLYPPSYRLDIISKCRAKRIVPIMMNRWCTTEYKRKPLTKWAKQNGIVLQYIGIAADEAHRARRGEFEGIELEYPLVDRRIGRDDCKQLIREAGLSVPPKSGCWICPFQRLSEWRELYDLRPDLFQVALELDNAAMDAMRKKRLNPFEGQLTQKFHKPLAAIAELWDRQIDLPGMPDPEYEYQMCECRL